MAARVVPGRRVRVVVPGSSANLGPGFDAVGLALGFHDTVEVEVAAPPQGRAAAADVHVSGPGERTIATGEANLVVRSVRTALDRVGAPQPDLVVRSANGVPHGRGVGSSAAAVVAGVVAARGLLERPELLDAVTALELASDLEGHPDNASARLLGAMTVGWSGPSGARAVRLEPHPDLAVVVCLPDAELSTARARAMLPPTVPHADAAFTAGRAALLVEAVTRQPDLLLPATADRIHQGHRAPAMPATAEAVETLRSAGLAAVVSGAGPSVLVLGRGSADPAGRVRSVLPGGWVVAEPGVDLQGAVLTVLDGPADDRDG